MEPPHHDLVSSPIQSHVVLKYRGAYDWAGMWAWLGGRALDEVERVEGATYTRAFASGGVAGLVHLAPRGEAAHGDPGQVEVAFTTAAPLTPEALADLTARVTRVLDLDRDLAAMRRALASDPVMCARLDAHVGVRVPGGWDPFELAVRAVLGQQVTIGAARQLGRALVQLCGGRLPAALATGGISRLFPTPQRVADADLDALRMPRARRATLRALAEAALTDDGLFAPRPLDEALARLRAVRGIGDWTAHYIALRALRQPDAFPASDVGLLRGATTPGDPRPTSSALLAMAEVWRPHRAYAAQLLWAEDAARVVQ